MLKLQLKNTKKLRFGRGLREYVLGLFWNYQKKIFPKTFEIFPHIYHISLRGEGRGRVLDKHNAILHKHKKNQRLLGSIIPASSGIMQAFHLIINSICL